MSSTTTTHPTTATPTTFGGTKTTAELPDEPLLLRLYVPTASAETVLGLSDDGQLGVVSNTTLQVKRVSSTLGQTVTHDQVQASTTHALGMNSRGFVGALTTVDHGNVLIMATGAANLGKDFESVLRTGEIVEATMALGEKALDLFSSLYYPKWVDKLDDTKEEAKLAYAIINAVQAPMSGEAGGGLSNIDYLKTGTVQLFGGRSVKIQAIESVSSSAALLNCHTGGAVASLSSLVVAGVTGGATASLKGGYSATVHGGTANLVGGREATVASRVGWAKVLGQSIRIGNKLSTGGWTAAAQAATTDVWLRGNEFVEIAVPSRNELPVPAIPGPLAGLEQSPTGVQIRKSAVRVATERASTTTSADHVTTIAGRSVLDVGPSSTVITRTELALHSATSTTLSAARLAYHTAATAAEGWTDQLKRAFGDSSKWAILGGLGVIGAAAAVGTGVGLLAGQEGASETDTDESTGGKIGEIAGGVIAGLGATLAIGVAAFKAAGVAQRLAHQTARELYLAAIKDAVDIPSVAATVPDPEDPRAPRIEVNDSGICLTVGPPGIGSSIKITATGIEIVGASVRVNDIDMPLPPMEPAIPSVPDIPFVPEPPDEPLIPDWLF